ncbi:hypothetical protein JOY44_02020 [Phormidium sp. CLA17]|uniref:hypothetical protein n=1 Tax=Leptolyngbya sp. Cla-17 TaxID=2803751 RepID=UPI0014920734|nr:hypothetical protein [Leptolyngbya sp. Cla-17]MBM0740404.1 hypothetical protein [Leptolyngbya sp. Cla-17]
MSSAVSHALILNRVRLTLGEIATLSQRQQWQRRLDSALNRVCLYPDLPPQAILVVRHLPDPQPGSLLTDNLWRGLRDWEQAAQNALNDCWHTAVRPAQTPVSSTANSVWFADPAEWLACLAWDVYRGIAGDRWWWQTALRPHTQRNRAETLFQLWREDAQWLPAALTLLLRHPSSSMVTLLAALTDTQARQLRAQVLQVYQCPLPTLAAPAPVLPFLILALQPYLSPPVRRFLPSLPLETQALLAVCLTLPHTAQFLDVALTTLPKATTAIAELSTQPQPLDEPPTALPEPAAPKAVSPPAPTVPRSSVPKIVAIQSTPFDGQSMPEGIDRPQATDAASASPSTLPLTPSPDSAPDASVDVPVLDPPFFFTTDLNLEAEQGVATAVGGLWYLVNVLVGLNWPGRTPTLTPWHQLSALAQSLLPEVPLDPVWGLLAELAGEPVPDAVLAQWQEMALEQVYAYLAERLEQPDALSGYLLEPATLYLTRTHVDVVFTLDQIRLDVRMAGLDRDPGWVPEMARAIAFHYE